MGFPRLGGALVAAPAAGSEGRESCDSQGVCFEDDPFAVGQCGWYAEGRRPDLLGIVGIDHDDAGAWLEEAAGRVPEGSLPVVGALAVWVPNVRGYSGPLGHVAYVAAVSGSRIFVEDSNWRPTPWSPPLEVHEHWDPAGSVSGFIYGGPAGNGPA
jgi:surface antigen